MSNPHEGHIKNHELLNYFVNRFNYKTYLELGVRNPYDTFYNVDCAHKESVDIDSNSIPTWNMSTDEFFDLFKENKYDLIFIDACHDYEFVKRDFFNSLARLNPNGTIVIDDINPHSEYLLDNTFCSDSWVFFSELSNRSDLITHAITPSLAGIVRLGTQNIANLEIERTWEFLETNREKLLKPIKFEDLDLIIK